MADSISLRGHRATGRTGHRAACRRSTRCRCAGSGRSSTALNHVKDQLDRHLSFRWSCRMGICGSCGMNVDGEPKLTCATFLSDYAPGPVRVEPLANFPVMRDLVVDIGDFMREAAAGQAVDHPRRRRSRVDGRVPADARRARRLQAVQHVHQLHALLRRLPGLRPRPGLRRAGRHRPRAALQPRLPRPGRARAARRAHPSTRASGAARSWASARRVCPKHVDPAGAIQRYKLTAATGVAQGVPAAPGHAMTPAYTASTRAGLPAARCPTFWWLRRRSYFVFILRELSSVFVAWFVVLPAAAAARGRPGARRLPRFLDWAATPWVLVAQPGRAAVPGAPRRHLVQPRAEGDGGAAARAAGAAGRDHRPRTTSAWAVVSALRGLAGGGMTGQASGRTAPLAAVQRGGVLAALLLPMPSSCSASPSRSAGSRRRTRPPARAAAAPADRGSVSWLLCTVLAVPLRAPLPLHALRRPADQGEGRGRAACYGGAALGALRRS